MATYNAVDYAANEVTLPMKMSDAHSKGGRMRVLHDTYTQSGTGAVSSVINFGRIPAGARVWEATVSTSASLHASGKLNLAVGADEILAEATFNTTRSRSLEQGSATAASAAPKACTLGGIVTCTGDSAMAQIAATVITVTIKYTID
tara:strand:+ start:347 stop:787 length:441 start_codon:yes stop_codon:yes gene_type:complete